MVITDKIKIDLAKKQMPAVLYAMQNDENTRSIEISFSMNGVGYSLGSVSTSVSFKKPDGTNGWYDKLPNSEPAISVSGSVATIILAPQVLTCPGDVLVSVRMEEGNGIASSFPFVVNVTGDPANCGMKSENYYNVTNWSEVNTEIAALWSAVGGGGGNQDFSGVFKPLEIQDGVLTLGKNTNGYFSVTSDENISIVFASGKTQKINKKRLICYITYSQTNSGNAQAPIYHTYGSVDDLEDGFNYSYSSASGKVSVSCSQVKTINGTSPDANGNVEVSGGSGTSVTEVFTATYGETTYEEIRTAKKSGKICFCKHATNGFIFQLVGLWNTKATFSGNHYFSNNGGVPAQIIYEVNTEDAWTTVENQLQKTSEITSGSTEVQIPTAKAVYNYAQPKGDYLTDTDLSGAVNDALAKAKASGEFDGEPGQPGAPGKTPVKGTDYWTEADKADIVAAVIEALGGTPIFGVVDTDNNIIVYGDLADGTYSVKYEKENGDTVNIGNLVLDSNVYYKVTNSLIQCTNSNSATEVIGGEPYTATIIPNSGYARYYVLVYMGGVDISSSVVNGSNINIAEVTGDIKVVASCKEIPKAYTNLFSTSGDGFANNTDFSGASSGRFLTNYIPCKDGDVIHVKGATVYKAKAHNSVDNTWGSAVYAASLGEAVSSYDDAVKVYNITQATTGVSNIDKVQLEIRSGNTALDSVIITVNQDIVD